MSAQKKPPNRPKNKDGARVMAGLGGTDRRRLLVPLAMGAVVLAFIAVIAITLVHKNSEKNVSVGPPPPAASSDGSIRIGPRDAKVVVSAVEDFQCPACKNFEATSAAALADIAKGPAAVDYRPIAILNRMSSTNYSTRAASAAYCVAEADIGKWPAWHTAMFNQQAPEGGAGLTDDKIIDIARSVGIVGDQVAQCISSHKYADYVDANTAKATSSGINHTPTVSVNGKEISNPNPDTLRAAVADAAK
jgi:protein-disulfide isomerase